jgi:hypothetical protein
MILNEEQVIAISRKWVKEVVIGFNLCPFARKPFELDRIRFQVSAASNVESLARKLIDELVLLESKAPEEVETTLLIHPWALTDFEEYWHTFGQFEELLRQADLEGIIQLASFHPDYIFAGSDEKDPANYTNRSPFPMVHLIREEGLENAIAHYPEPEKIPVRNEERMRELGLETVQKLWHAIRNAH